VDAWLPRELLTAPASSAGLARYAKTETDVHLGSAAGPVVARLHPGALVSVAPSTSAHVLVALPDFRRFDDEKLPVTGYVASESLDAERRAVSPPRPEGRLVRDFPPIGLWPEANDGQPFAKALCGDIRVLSDGATWARVSQYHAGVELFGFTESIGFLRGQMRCVFRQVVKRNDTLFLRAGPTWSDEERVQAIPDGYVPRDAGAAGRFWEPTKGPSTVYWLVQDEARAACEEWKIEPGAIQNPRLPIEKGDLTFHLRRREAIDTDDGKVLASFDARYRPAEDGAFGELRIRGPSYRMASPSRRRPWGEDCETRYGFVGTSATAIRLYPDGPPEKNVVAWHPQDEEPWFLALDACKVFERAANEQLRADIAAIPEGEVHLECHSQTGPVFSK
jgi:hypothetical protein